MEREGEREKETREGRRDKGREGERIKTHYKIDKPWKYYIM